MVKLSIKLSDLDKEIITRIYENEMIPLSLLLIEMPEYHRMEIWRRIRFMKRAGIIENIDGMYKISDKIDISKISNEIEISIDMLKLDDTHIDILKLLKERNKQVKFAFIKYKINKGFWKVFHSIDDLIFLGFIRRRSKGIYEITDDGKKILEKIT